MFSNLTHAWFILEVFSFSENNLQLMTRGNFIKIGQLKNSQKHLVYYGSILAGKFSRVSAWPLKYCTYSLVTGMPTKFRFYL